MQGREGLEKMAMAPGGWCGAIVNFGPSGAMCSRTRCCKLLLFLALWRRPRAPTPPLWCRGLLTAAQLLAAVPTKPGRCLVRVGKADGQRHELDQSSGEDEARHKFLVELEFVQCLANPHHLHWLTTQVPAPAAHKSCAS